MKKITLLWCFLFCLVGTLQAQTQAELAELQAHRASKKSTSTAVDIQALLNRMDNIGSSVMPLSEYFTPQEISALYYYKRSQSSSRLADIIPTAGATETFAVSTGDFFFDPGGPGGSSTGGTPGNYPNCGCVTTTTLTGVDEITFNFFSVFATFDWLKIYDGADTTGAILYDNATGGANSGDITLADMIASNGSAVFTSSGGSLTFEFNSSTVVDYGGWEAEVTGGGGGGGPVTAYGFEAFNLNMYGSFDPAAPETFTSISMGANDGSLELSGDVDPFDIGTAYATTVTPGFFSLDTTTGVYSLLGPGGIYIGLSFHPINGMLYGVDDSGNLITVDKTNGVSTVVGAIDGTLAIADLAITDTGAAYGHDIAGDQIVSIDLANGATTIIGSTGFDANFAQGMTWDPNTDTVFLAAFNNANFLAEWRSVDTATGATTIVGNINDPNQSEVTWAGIPDLTPPVSNDECADATAVACGDVVLGDTTGDTDSGGNLAPDEFFSFTGSGSPQFVTISTCSTADFDTVLRVFEDCTLANEIAFNDDSTGCTGFTSELTFISDGTSTYYIMVEGFSSASGSFEMAVTCNDVAANDLCGDAIEISCGSVTAGSTTFATIDDSVAGNCNDTFDPTPFNPTVDVEAPGVWYTYTESNPGLVTDITLNLCDDADFDTKISVYTGDCGTLTCVAANDDNDDCTGFTSTVEFQSDGVSTYYILVHGFGPTSIGDFNLTMDCVPVAPPNDDIVNSIDVDEIGFPYTDPAVNMPGATVEGDTPADCNNAGVLGVWYNFTPVVGGDARAAVLNPDGYTSVTFYEAPDENASEADLVLVDWFDNQCVPGTETTIPVTAGQAYYVYVANHGTVTDIVIDGSALGVGDAVVEGFSYYPNPANNELNLNAGVKTIDSAAIYNILGQEVITTTAGTSNTTLNVADLSVGTYILKVVVDGEVGIYKIVKQ